MFISYPTELHSFYKITKYIFIANCKLKQLLWLEIYKS